ncbi:small integral membrane protein 32-like isoform X2 [Etheostoma cragini]|uniref:small integral membrane protein 32-like isoform X2 n=1 Tax=Etheostoma cragini TaxID=417921 RepID=UPI00155F5073|nr:small integral membrane protein 32-like isoform X2 [Etheostoma cragini]
MRSRDFVFSSSPAEVFAAQTKPVSKRGAMLRQILLNSTDTPDFDQVLMAHSSTHAPSSLNASHGGSVSVAALLRPTAGRGGAGVLREGELHKPDLITYIVMCLLLFLLVLLIVFFINCQLRNSFFASMPYDRSLREARTYK